MTSKHRDDAIKMLYRNVNMAKKIIDECQTIEKDCQGFQNRQWASDRGKMALAIIKLAKDVVCLSQLSIECLVKEQTEEWEIVHKDIKDMLYGLEV